MSTNNKTPVYLGEPGMICSLGDNTKIIGQQLFAQEANALSRCADYSPAQPLPLGQVLAPLPALSDLDKVDRSRNNQLLLAALAQIKPQLDRLLEDHPSNRIGVVLGTSTSGIATAENAIAYQLQHSELPEHFDYQQQEIGAPAQFLARHLKLAGPATTISTACSSGAKAMASARRLIRSGVCDAVICGGVDTLCQLTVNGFSSLAAISPETCLPFSANRQGINIGEAACIFILSTEPSSVCLSGVGESSDAHHISAPHPEGSGAAQAMQAALSDGGCSPDNIDYLNLHGTATEQNDKMESLAVARVLGVNCPCSSTKPLTGHTLGAAGALEAGICYLSLLHQRLPLQHGDGQWDPALANLNWVGQTEPTKPIQHVMSNSFAFGGNNISLLLSRPTGLDNTHG